MKQIAPVDSDVDMSALMVIIYNTFYSLIYFYLEINKSKCVQKIWYFIDQYIK